MNHSDSGSILGISVGEVLDRFGSSDPTPGGGAAAALAGALGAALIEMTANLTIGRPRYAEVEPQARSIAERANKLRLDFSELADEDAKVFQHVGAAYRLPRQSEADKAARSEAIQTALTAAAQVPLKVARACATTVALAQEAAPLLNASVISDVLVGASLAQASLQSAALNVEINLASMTDAAQKQRLSAELVAVQDGVAERVEQVHAAGRARFPKS